MNHQEQIDEYILSHIEPEPALLAELDRHTHVTAINSRMLSGHLEGRILKMITKMIGAKRVLELGTFTGYSALCFAEAVAETDGVVVTVDNDDENGEVAAEFFAKSEYGKHIRQVIGDALTVIPTLASEEPFDLVFIDADKREYPQYLEATLPLLRQGGVILADNTLWDGHVVETPKHNDYQTIAVQKFNDIVANDPRVETVILPLRDGLTMIRKK